MSPLGNGDPETLEVLRGEFARRERLSRRKTVYTVFLVDQPDPAYILDDEYFHQIKGGLVLRLDRLEDRTEREQEEQGESIFIPYHRVHHVETKWWIPEETEVEKGKGYL